MSDDLHWQQMPILCVVQEGLAFGLRKSREINVALPVWLAMLAATKSLAGSLLYFVLTFILLGLAWGFVTWRNFHFALTEHAVSIKEGVFERRNIQIPLKSVKSILIVQPWLYRSSGLVRVQFVTSDEKCVFAIPALKHSSLPPYSAIAKVANTIKHEDDGVLIRLPGWRLILDGLCQNRLFVFIGSGLVGYIKLREWFPGLDLRIEQWTSQLVQEGTALLFLASVLTFSAVLSALISFYQTAGFQLIKRDNDLVASFGLQRKVEQVSLDRVSYFTLYRSLLARLCSGLSTATFTQCGGNSLTVPAVMPSDTQILINVMFPGATYPLAFKRGSISAVVFPLIVFAGPLFWCAYMSVMAKDALDFALFFSISGVAVLYWHLAGWYLTGYAVTENAIFLRCGRFGEVTYLVPPKSIQSLRVSTLRARATVWFDLPGAEFKLHAIDTRDVSKIKSMVIIEAEKRSPNLF